MGAFQGVLGAFMCGGGGEGGMGGQHPRAPERARRPNPTNPWSSLVCGGPSDINATFQRRPPAAPSSRCSDIRRLLASPFLRSGVVCCALRVTVIW